MVLQRLLELPWGKSDVFFCKKLPKKTAKLRLAFWKKTWPTSTQFFFGMSELIMLCASIRGNAKEIQTQILPQMFHPFSVERVLASQKSW